MISRKQEGWRGPNAPPAVLLRFSAANDNVPPLRHRLKGWAIAASVVVAGIAAVLAVMPA